MRYLATITVEFEYDGEPNAEFIHSHGIAAIKKAVENEEFDGDALSVGLADVFEEQQRDRNLRYEDEA